MQLVTSLHHSDNLRISRWELIKLFCGFQLKVSALNINDKKFWRLYGN